MKHSELMILHEDVSSYLACVDDTPATDIVTEKLSIFNISKQSVEDPDFNDPGAIHKMKKELQSCKRWDKVLKILPKLNAILAGGVLIGGVATAAVNKHDANVARSEADSLVDPDGSVHGLSKCLQHFDRMADSDDSNRLSRNAAIATVVILLIQAVIAKLTPLLKKAIKDREIKDISAIKGKVDSSISLYEKQLKNVKSEEDRKRLQGAIDDLNNLKEMMTDEQKTDEQ